MAKKGNKTIEELGDETVSGSQRQLVECLVNDIQECFKHTDATLPELEDDVSSLLDNLHLMTRIELMGVIASFSEIRQESLCESYRVDIFDAAAKALVKKGR